MSLWSAGARCSLPSRPSEAYCVKKQIVAVASPRNHQERTAVSRRGRAGGILTGEPEDLSQGTDKRDLAAARSGR